jgi:ketosteroid isomerase-like protein
MRDQGGRAMTLQDQYDRLINEHFGYEATDDVDGVVASLAEEAEHHVVPSPVGVLHDKDQIRGYYEMLFNDVKGESVTPVRRLYGEGFVVDEAIWHGHVADGRPFLLDGRSGNVSFRILHVFEIADGRITRENVWCDLAAIQQQLDPVTAP